MCICSHTAGQVETGRYLKFSDEPACLSQLEALSQNCSGGWLSRHMMCRPLACTRAPPCTTMFIYLSHPRVEECCPLGWAADTLFTGLSVISRLLLPCTCDGGGEPQAPGMPAVWKGGSWRPRWAGASKEPSSKAAEQSVCCNRKHKITWVQNKPKKVKPQGTCWL